MDKVGYTNISTEPVEADGYVSKPCMKSGFCCTKAPCAFGEYDLKRQQCKYLAEPNDIGQRDCLRYNWILENVPEELHKWNPSFGTGCCMPIGNTYRDAIVKKALAIK